MWSVQCEVMRDETAGPNKRQTVKPDLGSIGCTAADAAAPFALMDPFTAAADWANCADHC